MIGGKENKTLTAHETDVVIDVQSKEDEENKRNATIRKEQKQAKREEALSLFFHLKKSDENGESEDVKNPEQTTTLRFGILIFITIIISVGFGVESMKTERRLDHQLALLCKNQQNMNKLHRQLSSLMSSVGRPWNGERNLHHQVSEIRDDVSRLWNERLLENFGRYQEKHISSMLVKNNFQLLKVLFASVKSSVKSCDAKLWQVSTETPAENLQLNYDENTAVKTDNTHIDDINKFSRLRSILNRFEMLDDKEHEMFDSNINQTAVMTCIRAQSGLNDTEIFGLVQWAEAFFAPYSESVRVAQANIHYRMSLFRKVDSDQMQPIVKSPIAGLLPFELNEKSDQDGSGYMHLP